MKKRYSLDLCISFKKSVSLGMMLLCLTPSFAPAAELSVRIKDIVTFEGIRENQLVVRSCGGP
jgi:flagellar basal body P-ring protein FlgI